MSVDDSEKESAKRWTYYIETLKRTVDCIYEICRTDQSVIGCKEALMFLKNSVRDFEALIESINVEISWKQETKPHSVAWEIRKIMSPRNKPTVDGDSDTLIDVLKLSPVVVHKAVENAEEKLEQSSLLTDILEDKENQEKRRNKLTSVGEDGWRLVTGRLRRRKPASERPTEGKKTNSASRSLDSSSTMDVYERLSSGILRPTNSQRTYTSSDDQPNAKGLMYPRCAMDLPQTKASMAKMAYSRQLLWKKNQSLLVEKLRRKRRQNLQTTRRPGSTNAFSCINFADPVAVARSAEAFKNKQKMQQATNKQCMNKKKINTFESIKEALSENDTDLLISTPNSLPNKETPSSKSEPPFSVDLNLLDGLDADDEWRAMTEEEESLVQEEESLKREIEEQEGFSIDAELERQVASDLEKRASFGENAADKETEESPMTAWQNLVNDWKEEMEKCASVSWNEIVEREIGRYRKPGELAQIHEKLSSPSRKRNPENSRKQEERQLRAEELRIRLQEGKSNRLKELSKKVEEVRKKREQLFERKKDHLERRMEKATENRQKSLEEIIKKARDDDVKVMEVQFINALEADSIRHSVLAKSHEWEQRMQTIAEERAKKTGEKAAKESAVEERRKTAELQKAEKILEKRVRKEQAEFQRMEQEKERVSAVKKKQQEIVERVAEKKANEAAESEKLMKKIQQKQEETRRRYEDTLMHVKQRAVGLSSPRPMESVSFLADFYLLPSEDNYYSKMLCDESLRGCGICGIQLDNDFGLVAHFLSEAHLQIQGMGIGDITSESMKVDFDRNFIVLDSETRSEVLCTDECASKSGLTAKKRRNRMRQKIISRSLKLDTSADLEENNSTRANTTKERVDRPMRDLLKVIKANLSETTISQVCQGLTQQDYSIKSFSSADIHVMEKNLLELNKAICSNNSNGISDIFTKSFINSGLFNALIALLLCSPSGNFLVPSRLACKILSLIMTLTSSSTFLMMILFTERILVFLDALCIKFKLLIVSLENDNPTSMKQFERSHVELYLLMSIFCSIFKLAISSSSSKYRFPKTIDDPEARKDRLNALISLLVANGIDDMLAKLFKSAGNTQEFPWRIRLDNDELCVFLSVFTRFISLTDGLFGGRNNNSTQDSAADTLSGAHRNDSTLISFVRPSLYSLSKRIYSMVAAETISLTDLANSVSLKNQSDEHEMVRFLIFSLTQMWCLVVKFEPTEAEKFVLECEFPLRLVYIWSYFMNSLEKSLEPSANTNSKRQSSDELTEILHSVIYGIGYFASIHLRAQAFCILGWQHSLLNHLSVLPFKYFSSMSHMTVLLPSIVAICFESEAAVKILKRNLSCQILETFLMEAEYDKVPEKDRFKKEFWPQAIEFFRKNSIIS